MTTQDDVDVGALRFEVRRVEDTNFHKKPVQSAATYFGRDEVPDVVRDYRVGPVGVLAMALDGRGIIVATASGRIIEHAGKASLLCIGYAGSDPPYTDKGLELRLLEEIAARTQALGVSGVLLTEEVAAQVRAWQGKVRSQAESIGTK
jgi:hypothetical protein